MSTYFGSSISIPETSLNSPTTLTVSANTTLSAAAYGKSVLIQSPANYTITLPLIVAGYTSSQIVFINDSSTGTSTISAQGSNSIRLMGASISTFNLGPGDTCTLVNNGTTWSFDVLPGKANLASPAFTGTPTAPTPSNGSNNTSVATTAFVNTALLNSGFAPQASPTFLGTPTGPTPAQFDNSTNLATTAFVQRAIGNFTGYGTTYSATGSIPASAAGTISGVSSGGITLTLPATTSIANGGTITLIGTQGAGASPSTIQRAGTDSIYLGATPGTSIQIGNGDAIELVCVSTGVWYVIGSAALTNSALFGASLSGNGYQKLPSGLIIQWGRNVVSASSTLLVTLPMTFPANFFVATAALGATTLNATLTPCVGASKTSNSQITLQNVYSGSGVEVDWFAVGN